MTELEKVEKLREKADVTFAEAKEALDKCDGDILDALIFLEQQGKSTVPAGDGFFSGAGTGISKQVAESGGKRHGREHKEHDGETFRLMMKRFGRFLLKMFNKGNSNYLDAKKGDTLLFSCPVTVLVLLVLFFFWVTIPLFVISLFCGFRYSFRGADLGNDSVNRVMDNAANMVDDVKKSFAEGKTDVSEESDQ